MAMALSVPRFTVDDLDRFPDDGNRYELLDGLLLVTPAPSAAHQVVANRLQVRLSIGVQLPGYAHVVGPGALSVPPGTQLQPDILVYPSRFSANTEWAKITEHWLAVELLSPSSRMYDREFKRDAYFALGLPQVWLVDCRDASAEIWREGGVHEVVRDVIRWRAPTLDRVVSIELDEVFGGVA